MGSFLSLLGAVGQAGGTQRQPLALDWLRRRELCLAVKCHEPRFDVPPAWFVSAVAHRLIFSVRPDVAPVAAFVIVVGGAAVHADSGSFPIVSACPSFGSVPRFVCWRHLGGGFGVAHDFAIYGA